MGLFPMNVGGGGTSFTSLLTTTTWERTKTFTAQSNGVCLIYADSHFVSDTSIKVNNVDVTTSLVSAQTITENSNARVFMLNVNSGDVIYMTTVANQGVQYFMMS